MALMTINSGNIKDSPEIMQRRRFIFPQPILSEAEGIIARPYIAEPKLKNTRIYFSPKQSGSGIPAVTNVRSFTTWSNIQLTTNDGTITTPNFPANTYGGYYDCDTGILTSLYDSYTITESDNISSYTASGDSRIFWVYIPNLAIYNTQNITPISNKFDWRGITKSGDRMYDWCFSAFQAYPNSIYVQVPASVLPADSLDGAKQWIAQNNFQIVGLRKDGPIQTNIGAMTIKLSRGNQLVTSSSTKKINLSFNYWTNPISKKYEFVDHLTTIGCQTIINTGVSGATENLEIYGDADLIKFKRYSFLFGNNINDNYRNWGFLQSSSTSATWLLFRAYDGNTNLSTSYKSIPWSDGFNLKFYLKQGYVRSWINGEETISHNTDAEKATNTVTICIGSARYNVTDTALDNVYRIRSFKFWSGDTLLRDYKPCIRLSDNKPGFYDLVNQTFNPSIGAKDFIPGYD